MGKKRWAVFEKDGRFIDAKYDSIVLSSFKTKEEAERLKLHYGFTEDIFYVGIDKSSDLYHRINMRIDNKYIHIYPHEFIRSNP